MYKWRRVGTTVEVTAQLVYISDFCLVGVVEWVKKKNSYNFYLVVEVPDHVYVFYAYRLYFADKDIYIIRYFYHKIEIVRVF